MQCLKEAPGLRTVLLAAVSSGALSVAPAFAQDGDSVRDEPRGDVITVTARRREENLNDVPLAINAFTEEGLVELNVGDITDIAELTPGFAMQNNSRQNEQPFIRGMSVNSFFRESQNASFFHDGIYVAGVARTMQLDDIERVEVVLGPQAVYFGRQTFAGAVNYISKKPTFDWAGHARLEVAEDEQYAISGGISGPLVDDMLAFRLYAKYAEDGGAFQNTLDSFRVQTEETEVVSGSLTFKPTSNLEFTFRAQLAELVDGHNTAVLTSAAINNCFPNTGGVNQAYCGEVPIPSEIALNLTTLEYPGGRRSADQEHYALFGEYAFANGITLSSTTAWNSGDLINSADGDARPVAVFGFTFVTDYEDFTQQLILTSPSEQRLRWTAGAVYFDYTRTESSLTFPFNIPSTPNEVVNYGIFGAIEYDFTDRLTAAFEGRFNSDEITLVGTGFSNTFEAFLPRVVVDYDLSDDTMIYALAARGNRPGDFNTNSGVAPEDQIVDEQYIWNYETGVRHTYAEGRGQLNANLYYIDWTGQTVQQQVPSAPGFPTPVVVINVNAGETEIWGLEIEATNQWTDNFDTRIGYSYTNAEYQDFISNRPVRWGGDPQVGGNMLQNTPEQTFNAAANYSTPLLYAPGWEFFVNGVYTYRSSQYLDETNTAELPATNLVNAAIGFENDRWRFTAFGRNLTDEDTPAFGTIFSDFTAGATPAYLLALREPRYFGVRIDLTY
ncbi:MAG: TonB-dependent receptor [Oceanicaulis sp.]